MIVKTQSGSTYRIDIEAGTWERLDHHPDSHFLRTESGTFESIGDVVIGRSMVLIGPSLTDPAAKRVIETTPVVDDAEDLLNDVRLQATADATKRMIDAEDTQAMVNDLVTQRQKEYSIAAKALRQATEIGETPADLDGAQTLIGEIAVMHRDKPMSEALASLLNNLKAADAPDQSPA
jgi:hypothetical protein